MLLQPWTPLRFLFLDEKYEWNPAFSNKLIYGHNFSDGMMFADLLKYKDEAFKEGQKLYIGKRKQEVVIKTYRRHKVFDMLTFVDVDSINDAIAFKGDEVFIKREDLIIDGLVDEDIIGLEVYGNDKLIGIVEGIVKNKQEILLIKNNDKNHMIPFVEELVQVDLENKKIIVNMIEGLINED